MLKTYEVAIENGQVMWLEEKPQVTSGRALLTILEDKLPFKGDTHKAILLELDGSEQEMPFAKSNEINRPHALCDGEFKVPDDFDNPLPENILQDFENPL
jgi:hypothetical protein